MKRLAVIIVLLVIIADAQAQVKVGGQEIVPKGLIFGDADAQSRVTAQGELGDGCEWTLAAETRFAEQRVGTDCYLDYRRTSILLTKKCPAPAKPEPVMAERTTTGPKPRCPEEGGEITPPEVEAKAISSGTTPDGKQQAILVQPEGTRLTMSWDEGSVQVVIRFPDGTTDVLQIAAEKPKEE